MIWFFAARLKLEKSKCLIVWYVCAIKEKPSVAILSQAGPASWRNQRIWVTVSLKRIRKCIKFERMVIENPPKNIVLFDSLGLKSDRNADKIGIS